MRRRGACADAISAAIIREWELTHPPTGPHAGCLFSSCRRCTGLHGPEALSPHRRYTGPTTAVCAKAYINSDEPNPETAWVLEYFGIPKPPILKHINDIPFPVFGTVDTNNVAEMPPGAADVVSDQIQSIVDHHKLTGLVTLNPDEVDVRPIGSAGAVLFSRSRQANRPIPGAGCEKNIAGLMLATILSDTLGLTSSTTTESDKTAVDILAPLAGIDDTMGWTKQMLEAKSSIAQYTPADIVMLDSKIQGPFTDPTGATFLLRVAVQETITPDVLFDQADEIGAACQAQLKIDQASTDAAMLGDDGTNIVRDCLFFVTDVRSSFMAIDPSSWRGAQGNLPALLLRVRRRACARGQLPRQRRKQHHTDRAARRQDRPRRRPVAQAADRARHRRRRRLSHQGALSVSSCPRGALSRGRRHVGQRGR